MLIFCCCTGVQLTGNPGRSRDNEDGPEETLGMPGTSGPGKFGSSTSKGEETGSANLCLLGLGPTATSCSALLAASASSHRRCRALHSRLWILPWAIPFKCICSHAWHPLVKPCSKANFWGACRRHHNWSFWWNIDGFSITRQNRLMWIWRIDWAITWFQKPAKMSKKHWAPKTQKAIYREGSARMLTPKKPQSWVLSGDRDTDIEIEKGVLTSLLPTKNWTPTCLRSVLTSADRFTNVSQVRNTLAPRGHTHAAPGHCRTAAYPTKAPDKTYHQKEDCTLDKHMKGLNRNLKNKPPGRQPCAHSADATPAPPRNGMQPHLWSNHPKVWTTPPRFEQPLWCFGPLFWADKMGRSEQKPKNWLKVFKSTDTDWYLYFVGPKSYHIMYWKENAVNGWWLPRGLDTSVSQQPSKEYLSPGTECLSKTNTSTSETLPSVGVTHNCKCKILKRWMINTFEQPPLPLSGIPGFPTACPLSSIVASFEVPWSLRSILTPKWIAFSKETSEVSMKSCSSTFKSHISWPVGRC